MELFRDVTGEVLRDKIESILINWGTLCRSREDEGIGVRHAGEISNALLARLGWHMLNDQKVLWSRTLINKYGRG